MNRISLRPLPNMRRQKVFYPQLPKNQIMRNLIHNFVPVRIRVQKLLQILLIIMVLNLPLTN